MRPHRKAVLVALIGFIFLAIYGSLVPFHWSAIDWQTAFARFMAIVARPLTFESRSDWVTNVLLFVPIGFFASGLVTPRCTLAWRTAIAALILLCSFLLSVGIEAAQLWTTDRTCSQNDIAAESIGGLIGIIAWQLMGSSLICWLSKLWNRSANTSRLEQSLEIYLLLVVMYMLMPLDFSIRPSELFEKLKLGSVVIVPFSELRSVLMGLVDVAQDVLLMLPIGMLVAVWRWPRADTVRSFGSSMVLGGAIASSIELCQLPVLSRKTSSTDLLMGLLGIAIGWAAARLRATGIGRASSTRAKQTSFYVYLASAILTAIVLAAIFCVPFDHIAGQAEAAERLRAMLTRPPLAAFYTGSESNAVGEVLRKGLHFALLGMFCGLAVQASMYQHRQRRRLLKLGIAGCFLFAGIVELLQIWLPPHIPDLTDALIAGAGATLGLISGAASASDE